MSRYFPDVPQAPTLRFTTPDESDQVIASSNDGHEVWFGYPDQWRHHLQAPDVRRLFWWLLFRWYGQARWFGLRRPIYYWRLRRHLRRKGLA